MRRGIPQDTIGFILNNYLLQTMLSVMTIMPSLTSQSVNMLSVFVLNVVEPSTFILRS